MGKEKTKLSKLQQTAEELLVRGVTNKAILNEALPLLIELQSATTAAQRHAKACGEVVKALSEACTAYVTDHPSVLEAGDFIPNQNGVLTGDVVIDDRDYHISCGFDGYVPLTRGQLTQAFLATLPEGWTRTKTELSTSAINAANPTDEELAAAGLRQKPKNVWTMRE